MIRGRETVPDLWLLTAPIRPERFEWIVEKATELGVRRIVPVLTARTNHARLKPERLRAHMVEAAEQCGRTRVPKIVEPVQLRRLVGELDPARHLYFADESGGGALTETFRQGPALILVGPEGGFTTEERGDRRACGAIGVYGAGG
jgi:16S rRNA (uracil1498-N3)-methyltransferase